MVRTVLRVLPALLVAAAIFLLSSVPGRELPMLGSWDVVAKKGAHVVGYGLLAAAAWAGLGWKRKVWWLAILLAVAYAATDELHQRGTPGRHPALVDVGIDAAGAAAGVLLSHLVRRRQRAGRLPS
jgi:VanZ family protein